jgi:nitrogen fixation/metabolism regulation signal transduction histidine kinase
MMQRQLDHLVRLVDDLMDMSRISRGKLDLRKEQLDLGEVLASAVEASSPLIQRHEHELRINIADGRFPVSGDATRLAQIISNLMNNAAKYTHQVASSAWTWSGKTHRPCSACATTASAFQPKRWGASSTCSARWIPPRAEPAVLASG